MLSCCLFLALFFNWFERLTLSTSARAMKACVELVENTREVDGHASVHASLLGLAHALVFLAPLCL